MKPIKFPNFKTLSIFLCVFAIFIVFSCKQQKEKQISKPIFKQQHTHYISAYTSGQVPKETKIFIRFAKDVVGYEEINKEENRKIMDFDPKLAGTLQWIDSRTLQFTPQNRLPSATIFDARVDLKPIFDTVPDELRWFYFQFHTQAPKITFRFEYLKPVDEADMKWRKLHAVFYTSEYEEAENVEKIVTAKLDNNLLKARWVHSEDRKMHRLIIDSIARQEQTAKITLHWNGEFIRSKDTGSFKINLPALGDFSLVQHEAVSDPEQTVKLQFSDPLDAVQNLQGLIRSKQSDFTFRIDGNQVIAWPKKKLLGEVSIVLEPGIKNILGYKLKEQQTINLLFTDIKPDIRAVGNGTIIPRTNGSILFPFEAVNLKAVDVRVMKIYENNVLQFLQFNELSGSSYMDYVGKVLVEKKIELNADKNLDLGKWNKHALDLSKFINAEPGAIYRIFIRFRKDYSLYKCENEQNTEEQENEKLLEAQRKQNVLTAEKETLWSYYEEGYYWHDNSPCGNRYFRNYNRIIQQNILASDIGIIAKSEPDGPILMAITDLGSTKPLANVQVEAYNRQRRLINSGVTDNNGFCKLNSTEKPFLILAKSGRQKGYLKMQYNPLSLSAFSVDGQEYKQGVKGFLYSERGVWRPGDSIYLTFIIEDKLKALPKNHPIVFEFLNPEGQVVQKQMKKESVNGFYTFHTKTDENAPTGNYQARVNVGGVMFDKNIKVETIVPNRLKLEMKELAEEITSADKKIGQLQVSWLHGAPASELYSELFVSFRKSKVPFNSYAEYSFQDPAKEFTADNLYVFQGKLDENGKAEIANNITVTEAPGPLEARFLCKVQEPGGNFSTDNFTSTYHPYKQYVGVKIPVTNSNYSDILFTGKSQNIEFVTVTDKGLPVNGKVEVYMYKLKWEYWYDYDSEQERSTYMGRTFNSPAEATVLLTKNGKASWKINMDHSDYGRYLIRAIDEKGHVTGKIVFFNRPGWYSRNYETTSGTNILTFNTNKEEYKIGETAVINIPGGHKGRALVTIENGRKILQANWVEMSQKNNSYSFKITKEMAPNAYASVMIMQPHAKMNNDAPIRLYGYQPILVDGNAKHLEPILSLPDVLKPEQKTTLYVNEKSGKAMTYTIAMVDEGLLDLTRFKTPDPFPAFNAKEALQIKTWDLYEHVMGNHIGNMKKFLTIGGDGEAGPPGSTAKVQRFKPMVRYIGPFNLAAGARAKHTIEMPQYIGSVRTMIIAGDGNAYGSAEVTTPVRTPLMVLGTLPRVLGPDEEVDLAVSVFAMEAHVKEVQVEVKVNGLLQTLSTPKQIISFNEKGEKLVRFPIKVKNKIGAASVEVKATSGKETAKFNVELEVRAPNPMVTVINEANLPADSLQNIEYEVFGLEGTNSATLEVSAIPPLNLESRLSYLIRYPHGCVEQTTSSVFPQLFVHELIKLKDEDKRTIEKHIKSAINRLQRFQTGNGGLAYWPDGGYAEVNEWGTNYAGHFLIEAQNRGYAVPTAFMERWKNFQIKTANNFIPEQYNGESYYNVENNQLMQAYRLYLLSLYKNAQLGAMNRLREQQNLSVTARYMLAAAYHLAGQQAVALQLIKDVPLDIKEYREHGYTYGSTFRDKAILLEVMEQVGYQKYASKMADEIAATLRSSGWLSTQETAYGLLAISRYAKNFGSANLAFEYRENGKVWVKNNSETALAQLKLNAKTGKNSVEIRNTSGKKLHAYLVTQGIPLAGKEKHQSHGLQLNIRYVNLQGTEINVDTLKQGTDFLAEITVKNSSKFNRIDEVALSVLFPSGWQIHNPRMTNFANGASSSRPEYLDVRDDKVHYYFDFFNMYSRNNYYGNDDEEDDEDQEDTGTYKQQDAGQQKTFRIGLNASFTGTFYLPSSTMEAMYDNKLSAATTGKWVTVIKSVESF